MGQSTSKPSEQLKGERGIQGIQGVKGDKGTWSDFSSSEKSEFISNLTSDAGFRSSVILELTKDTVFSNSIKEAMRTDVALKNSIRDALKADSEFVSSVRGAKGDRGDKGDAGGISDSDKKYLIWCADGVCRTNNNGLNLEENNYIRFGDKYDKEANAGMIAYGRFDGGAKGSLNIVGGGTNNVDRKVRIFDKLQIGDWIISQNQEGHLDFSNGQGRVTIGKDGNIWEGSSKRWLSDTIDTKQVYYVKSQYEGHNAGWSYLTKTNKWEEGSGSGGVVTLGKDKGEWQQFKFEK